MLELARTRNFPLRRVSPHADPICLESEFLMWVQLQPRAGESLRAG